MNIEEIQAQVAQFEEEIRKLEGELTRRREVKVKDINKEIAATRRQVRDLKAEGTELIFAPGDARIADPEAPGLAVDPGDV